MPHCYSGSQNNLHCSCNGTTSNGAAAAVCTGGVLARKVPNHSGASPGQGNKRPAVSLTHLPKRPPVDVEFKDLAYSVSEGRKRGEFRKSKFRKLHVQFREKLIPVSTAHYLIIINSQFIIKNKITENLKHDKRTCAFFLTSRNNISVKMCFELCNQKWWFVKKIIQAVKEIEFEVANREYAASHSVAFRVYQCV